MKTRTLINERLTSTLTALFTTACLLAASSASAESYGQDLTGPQILKNTCTACHAGDSSQAGAEVTGSDFTRIADQRKTPEGWLMTIARMQVTHGVKISDEDRHTLVKYLSDTQGLAPSESEGRRYALERRLNKIEDFREPNTENTDLGEMCARCHSGARFALQRRTEAEWEHTVHYHLGQWASLEYQALSRDREWLDIALNKTVPELAKRYPLETEEWDSWQAERPEAETLSGQWVFSGHYTGKGAVRGVMSVNHKDGDNFRVTLDGEYANGTPFTGKGSALLYNGHEWRAQIDVDGTAMRQVLVAYKGRMQGRMFQREFYERGLDFSAAQENHVGLLAVQPSYVKAGSETEVTVVGAGLEGEPDFGPGIEVLGVETLSPAAQRVKIRVADEAKPGLHPVKVGGDDQNEVQLAVYRQVDKVTVTPDYAVSRIGGGGGSTEKVQARFDAIAWTEVDGEQVQLGVMPAKWHVEPFNEEAKENRDVHFSGNLDQSSGVFTPAAAGPNPDRQQSSNNIGNLTVIAEVEDGERTVRGEGQLIVGVQVWSIPPIP